MKILSRIEELILLAICHLEDDAYGVTIRKYIIEKTKSNWSIGAIYVPLDRMEKWGYVKTSQGESTPERGGKSKRYYSLTPVGLKALKELRNVQESMWSDLPGLDLILGTDK